MDFKQRWAAASPLRAPISWAMLVCLVMCAGLRVEANDTVPSTAILSTESRQTSFDTSSNAPRSDVPSKESTVNIAVTVSTTEHYTASQSSTTLLSTSFTKDTTLPTQTSKNAATDTMSQTVSSVSAALPTTATEQPMSADAPTTTTERPTSADAPTTATEQPTSVESPTTKPEQPTSAEAPTTETEQPTSTTTNSSLSSSTVPSSATAANNKTEASTEHSVNTEKGNTTNAGSTTADINSTNVNTGSPLPASSQSSEKSDGPSTTGVENRATSATNLDSQKSAVVESPATKPPSIIGTPISTEEQRALSPGGVAAITIIVIAIVLVIFGGVAFWKIRNSSYGRLLEDQDYGSLGNYNNPLYDDS